MPLASEPYLVQVFPKISGLSSQTSGIHGGHSLIITGSGFDITNCSNNRVLLRGGSCVVTTCTTTSVTCVVGPKLLNLSSSTAPFASTRGLLHLFYKWSTNIYFNAWETWVDPIFPNYPTQLRLQTDGLQGHGLNIDNFYCQVLTVLPNILHLQCIANPL